MVLNFIEHIPEFELAKPITKGNVLDEFVKLIVVWGVSSNISPNHNIACLLIPLKPLHNKHDVLDVIRKLLYNELVVVF